jgi:pimeloyl-ACP methyl ester carboxylesterase
MSALDERFDEGCGVIRWTRTGAGPPIVLVHGTPYSSRIFRGVVPALAERREVFLFDHLGYGQSEQREGQDLSIAAQARRFARLLEHWGLSTPSVVATDMGGAITLRALLLEGAAMADLLLFDAVTGGDWERGLFALMLEHVEVPVRILWGRRDRILPPEYAEWIAARLPHAPLTREDNAGHLLAEDAPARLLAEILAQPAAS